MTLQPKQFGDFRQLSSQEVAGMSPDQYRDLIDKVASAQRGAPEAAMLRAQNALGGGVYPHALEHVGDLTHRINESGGRFGTEFVAPKVSRILSSLRQPYGFEREMAENVAGNARSWRRNTPVPTMEDYRSFGKQYADAHRALPVYNDPSFHGREAAVALGEHRFGDTVEHLSRLESFIQNEDAWRHVMSQPGSIDFLRRQESK